MLERQNWRIIIGEKYKWFTALNSVYLKSINWVPFPSGVVKVTKPISLNQYICVCVCVCSVSRGMQAKCNPEHLKSQLLLIAPGLGCIYKHVPKRFKYFLGNWNCCCRRKTTWKWFTMAMGAIKTTLTMGNPCRIFFRLWHCIYTADSPATGCFFDCRSLHC